jgi:hypothetical protein
MFVLPAVVGVFGFSTLIHNRLASSLCALFIVYQTYYDVWNGMIAFMGYLILDTLSSRKTVDILIHHIVGASITLAGMVLLTFNDSPEKVSFVVSKLLLMEVCTPLLHLNYALNSIKSRWLLLAYPLLLATWCYFRLYNPYMCIQSLQEIYDGGTAWWIVVLSFFPLMIMQWFWAIKIVHMGARKYLKL